MPIDYPSTCLSCVLVFHNSQLWFEAAIYWVLALFIILLLYWVCTAVLGVRYALETRYERTNDLPMGRPRAKGSAGKRRMQDEDARTRPLEMRDIRIMFLPRSFGCSSPPKGTWRAYIGRHAAQRDGKHTAISNHDAREWPLRGSYAAVSTAAAPPAAVVVPGLGFT